MIWVTSGVQGVGCRAGKRKSKKTGDTVEEI